MAMSTVAVADDWLSGQELQEKIAGHTITGITGEGDLWWEIYHADGKLEVQAYDGLVYVGTWDIDDDMMCSTFPDAPEFDGCWAMRLDGNVVTCISEHGESPEKGVLAN